MIADAEENFFFSVDGQSEMDEHQLTSVNESKFSTEPEGDKQQTQPFDFEEYHLFEDALEDESFWTQDSERLLLVDSHYWLLAHWGALTESITSAYNVLTELSGSSGEIFAEIIEFDYEWDQSEPTSDLINSTTMKIQSTIANEP